MAKTYYNLSEITFQPLSTNFKFKDLTGKQFGRLTVIGYGGRTHSSFWYCKCFCGKIIKTMTHQLTTSKTKSCGCYQREVASTVNRTIKSDFPKEYDSYMKAKQRCVNPHNNRYCIYGGRGIEFRFSSFEEFFAEVGARPTSQHSIDRIDVNGHYEKGNVRWANQEEQARNTRYNVWITINGETKLALEWASIYNQPVSRIRERISKKKWCGACAVLLPKDIGHRGCPHR